MVSKAQVNVNDGINESNGIYQHVLLAAEPYAGNAGEHGNIFQDAGAIETGDKLFV